MNPIERHLKKLGTEQYDLHLDAGRHFTVDEVGEALTADLLDRYREDRSITRDLIAMTAHSLARQVDRSRTMPGGDESPSMFEDLDRPIPVADGRRIVRRHMRDRDWAEHLAHVSGNAARVNSAAAREYSRHAALAPYLAEGLTTEAAVERWLADNPDGVLP